MVNSPSPHDDITVGETVRNKNLLWGSKKTTNKTKTHVSRISEGIMGWTQDPFVAHFPIVLLTFDPSTLCLDNAS